MDHCDVRDGSPGSSDEGTPGPEGSPGSPGTTITATIGKRKEVMTLPLPPGALPPRKRAKTKDEKEQRRIERIMRNRQAAHASREKKRKHVEELEKKCVSLETENGDLKSERTELQRQINEAKRNQLQMLEQHYATMNKLSQVQAALKTARATGDVSALDDLVASLNTAAEATVSFIEGVPSPAASTSVCASPDSLVLSTFTAPSLSSSVASSPVIPAVDETVETDEFYSLFDNSSANRAHHPAAVVPPCGQQRWLTNCFSRTFLTRLSLVARLVC